MQAFERVDESESQSKQKKGKKKREGPSMFYYEDDSKLSLEFPLIQKFSKLQVSPPIEIEELTKTEKTLQTLRDALKLKGQIEIAQNKAKLLKDESWVQGDEFEKMKAQLAEFDQEVLKRLDVIKRDKLNWNNDADEVGINIDEELDEEEIGQRFTKLQPDRSSRFGGGDRDNRGRRGRSQGPRQQQRRDEEPKTDQRQPKVRQERFNGTNAEDFPSL